MKNEFQDDGGRIVRVRGGFAFIIWGTHDTNTVLLIRDDGAMVDLKGEAVLPTEVMFAQGYLGHLGATDVARRVHAARFRPAEMAIAARRALGLPEH